MPLAQMPFVSLSSRKSMKVGGEGGGGSVEGGKSIFTLLLETQRSEMKKEKKKLS
jgi:hypothetical protein